ncbi:MAG: metal ABC transporter permease [Acetobacteraceae bacterium]|nr:metal ABC transporter permease [Acetobacteraceae bacterium]MDW8398673.1 metal ABC transporter permease [Acetobacteraceae bacterium]
MSFVALDLVPLLAAMLACLACGLVGNLLLLTRQSLLGDAVSHAVLPGIVLAFLLTGSRDAGPMLAGAVLAAFAAALLVGLVVRAARLPPQAAMGIVFTGFFALGVVLLEAGVGRRVHLDLDHVLLGQLEALVWPAAEGWHSLLDPAALAALPPEIRLIGAVALSVPVVLAALWKELRLLAFDPEFAAVSGFAPRALSALLLAVLAVVCVAAFWAVGAILAIAALVAPPAAARLLARSYRGQVLASAAVALAMGAGGVLLAGALPWLAGWGFGLSASGMVAVAGGVLVAAAALLARARESR